jgi:glycosyltransferase involved in cell wall biosynthesis
MAAQPWRVLWHPFFFLPERWNGMDEVLFLLSRHLDRSRFELLVLGHESDGPQTATLAARAGLRLIPAPYGAGAPAPSRLRALRSLFRAEGIDLLHFHSPAAGGQLVPALAARLAGVRASLATYHQVQPWLLPPRSRALNRVIHTRLIDHTLAVSEGVRQTLDARTGVPAGRVQVLHNGIDPVPAVTPPVAPALPWREPGTVLLGCFGRLSPEKGLPVVLQAMALLQERCPQAHLLIAGDGPQRGELEALADSLGLARRVHFLGFREDARALMGAVDVVVHAPAYEGFGLVVLEAMAAGKPVVVNDAPGGITEIVQAEETGLVVPLGSAPALADTLQRLVADPQARERLGRQGALRFQTRFTAGRMAGAVAGLYERCLGTGQPRAFNPVSTATT